MDPTAEFARLVRTDEPPLDRLAALVAAHARPGLDVDVVLAELDALAAGFSGDDAEALRHWLCREQGFRGNERDYYDPDNSMVDQVLRRRLGIPITLSLVMVEVGRRRGVDLVGVSLPGEFLVRERGGPAAFHNPFRDVAMDRDDVEELFRRLHGPHVTFDPALLVEVGPVEIVGRMLANLVGIALQRRDAVSLAWVLRLRTELPGAPLAEHRQLAGVLDGLGRHWEAADALERLAALDPPGAVGHLADVRRLRAHLN